MPTLLEAVDVTKTHGDGGRAVRALGGVSLRVDRGELVVVMGPSGSGKTTLLQLLGGLDRPSTGSVRFDGERLEELGDARLSAFRRRRLGFVFQFFHLLPTLSAEDNVLLPIMLDGRVDSAARRRARDLLGWLGLGARAAHKPHQLSGGEMQRVAIARALIAEPAAVLADEPTGNLDSAAGAEVMALLQRIVAERGTACIIVTHDPRAAHLPGRLVTMRDGRLDRESHTEILPSGVRRTEAYGVAV